MRPCRSMLVLTQRPPRAGRDPDAVLVVADERLTPMAPAARVGPGPPRRTRLTPRALRDEAMRVRSTMYGRRWRYAVVAVLWATLACGSGSSTKRDLAAYCSAIGDHLERRFAQAGKLDERADRFTLPVGSKSFSGSATIRRTGHRNMALRFIELVDRSRRLGQANIPARLTGASGAVFAVGRAVQGGGNGVVFDGYRLSSGGGVDRRVAVKMLRRQDAARVDRFENEARVMAALGSHPRIAPYYDHGAVSLLAGGGSYRVPWIAMELGGYNLRDHVAQEGPLAPSRLLSVAIQMCDALGHVHQTGFIHRDVKPANMVWDGTDDPASEDIMLIDFGIAKRVGDDVSGRPMDSFTRQGEFVGPVFFASPELIAYAEDPQHPVDHRSDIFQLGKVTWFLATGRISAGVPSKRDCPLGGRLRDVVLATLEDDPADRPQTTNAVAELLRSLA
ncbi:MAG: serine/threonine protein kinase [Kofleriaceae bacterium]|nr:MAG: serine/threonine protein kinase [Kofleriaceae bacterium]